MLHFFISSYHFQFLSQSSVDETSLFATCSPERWTVTSYLIDLIALSFFVFTSFAYFGVKKRRDQPPKYENGVLLEAKAPLCLYRDLKKGVTVITKLDAKYQGGTYAFVFLQNPKEARGSRGAISKKLQTLMVTTKDFLRRVNVFALWYDPRPCRVFLPESLKKVIANTLDQKSNEVEAKYPFTVTLGKEIPDLYQSKESCGKAFIEGAPPYSWLVSPRTPAKSYFLQ